MSSSAAQPRVFVVDEDVSVRESVEGLLQEEGFLVDLFESAEGFLNRTPAQTPACLIVDVALPGMSGLELHEELSRSGMDAPTIVLSGLADIPTSVRAMKAGAVDFLTKPYDADDLVAAVQRAVSLHSPQRAGGTLPPVEGMVGQS